MEDNPNFNLMMTSKELAEVRGWWGLSQAEFAKKLGVSVDTVARWERNEMPIPPTVPLALEAIGRREMAQALEPSEPLESSAQQKINL